ncbi:MAG TPA: hypothetical protein VGC76_14110 [Pyrinomonadaceae bacterium]|jgi:hypothetical protein
MAEEKNGNQDKVKRVIEMITGEEAKVIAVPSALIHFVGSKTSRNKTSKAVFLSQLIYWSDKGARKDGFIFKTHREWYEETGLSSNQISSYTKEFKGLDFIDTKLKKAHGCPTIHYRLKLDVFIESFAEYMQNGFVNNSRNQDEETDDSLTENTAQSTAENSLSNKMVISNEEKEKREESGNVKGAVSSSNGNTDFNQNSARPNLEEKIPLPSDFVPTLDNQYQAVRDFPYKSPAYITQKFIKRYQDRKVKMTASEWQDKWVDWILTERPMHLSDTEILRQEGNTILNKVCDEIFRFTYKLEKKVFHRDEIVEAIKDFYCENTVDEILKYLTDSKDLGHKNDYYFNLAECNRSSEWKSDVAKEWRELGLFN